MTTRCVTKTPQSLFSQRPELEHPPGADLHVTKSSYRARTLVQPRDAVLFLDKFLSLILD